MRALLCAAVGMAAGLSYLAMRLWLAPSRSHGIPSELETWAGISAALAVITASILWMQDQKLRGYTTQRRINMAYRALTPVLIATIGLNFVMERGWSYHAIVAFLLLTYIGFVWRAGRRLPNLGGRPEDDARPRQPGGFR